MVDELLSLRVVVASSSKDDRDLLQHAAAASKVPIEVVELEGASAAGGSRGGLDLVFLDSTLTSDEVALIVAAVRAVPKPPFTVLLAGPGAAAPFATDALAVKPTNLEEAKRLLEAVSRVRLKSRVLVVDDSPTMRSIVRKTLAATRFPLEVTEVSQGVEAIELARTAAFDIVFVDYNMPDFSGLETISEFRREKRQVTFVLITSTRDTALAERARAQGAAFLQKPFFPADIENVLCGFYGLRALSPKPA